ncbi:MAG TPA: alkene reductase [Drouetiella sp.]
MKFPHLLAPYELADLQLQNRVVLAPLTRGRASAARVPNKLMEKYYLQRAEAGLLITEATSISEQGIGWIDNPGIYNEQQTQGWKSIVDALHAQNSRVYVQLWHCGRSSHSSFRKDESLGVAPSALKIDNGEPVHAPVGKVPFEVPRALEIDEIPQVVEQYRAAAQRAKEAGFDGVEIHSANGYLIDQFLQTKTNKRTDKYGGTVENRSRFLKEIVEAVSTVLPTNRIGVRISPNGAYNDMGSVDNPETFRYVAEMLNKLDVGYLHVVDGLAFGFHGLTEPMTLADFRPLFKNTLMANCGYTAESADETIGKNLADLVAFGRPFISNPDLVSRFANGWKLADPAPVELWSAPTEKGYTDFPTYEESVATATK